MRKKLYLAFCFLLLLCLNTFLAACSSSTDSASSSQTSTQTAIPSPSPYTPSAQMDLSQFASLGNVSMHQVTVQVPLSMRTNPFSVAHTLNVPSGYSVAVYARIPGARFMAVTPDNNLLVSVPGDGVIKLVRPLPNGGDPQISDFLTGLREPQDMVFHKIGSIEYLYITESNEVNRYIYHNGDTQGQHRQIIIPDLPNAQSPGFNGTYAHNYKDIAIDSNNKLYLAISSSCNACVKDTQSNPLRDAIYQYNADGSGRQLFAQGLRNPEGLAFIPGSNDLWVSVNERDNLAYPFHDSKNQYGKVVTSYVDNHPPDEFTAVQAGGNYGWPFCNPDPDQGMTNMPFDRDVQYNADGHVNCSALNRISQGIQAHSAPLGLTFIPNTQNTSATGALISLHGSWDRSTPTGYKFIYFPWNSATNTPGKQVDLVTGWLTSDKKEIWGRPVDSVLYQNSIFISDDQSGTIYRLYKN